MKDPVNRLRVRYGREGEKNILILQIYKVPDSNPGYAMHSMECKWVDATVEDLSEVADLRLGRPQ